MVRASFWPSRTQELLLRTAFATPQRARAAWEELRSTGLELHTLEAGTMSVLPLVYRAVSASAPGDPLLPLLKGTYRSTWVRNNLLTERLSETMAAIEEAGVQTLMIGSLAAASRYYAEPALRPTPALDFLIAGDTLVAATRALGRVGWSAPAPPRLERAEPVAFFDRQGQICLLRVAAAPELPRRLEALLERAVAVVIGSRTVQALAPTDDLFVTCVSGARVRPVRSVDWLVDMAQIVRSVPSELDWDRLLALGAEYGQTLRLRRALAYMEAALEVPAPDGVQEALGNLEVSLRERLAYASAGAHAPPLGSFPQAVGEHLVATRKGTALRAIAAFPRFLLTRWGVSHGWQLPLAASRRIYRALLRTWERST